MKNIFIITCFFAFLAASAQVRLTGSVLDSVGMPIDMASLIATDTVTKEVADYGFTKPDGSYRLRLDAQKIYRLEVNYMGMKPIDFVFKTPKTSQKIVRNFMMKFDNQLEEVSVTYKIPIQIKGDTIVYNADRFRTGSERKLGEVLNKLPGVSVNKQGQIKVNGKAVQKIMVDGKNFFEGDTKLATENIPADVVEQVEVLKNFSEIAQMSGLGNNQDNIAINIKLKEGKKNFWFGDIGGGGGNLQRYLANPKLFYYSPKYNVSLITSFNNLGKAPFTWRDYMRFTGGMNAMSGALSVSDDMSFMVSENNYASSIISKFIASNLAYTPNKKIALSGFLIGADNRVDTNTHQDVSFVGGGNSSTDIKKQQRSKLGLAKFSVFYKPDHTQTLNYNIFGKMSDNGYKVVSDRVIDTQPNERITDETNTRPYNFSQKINYYKLIGVKHLLTAKVGHSFRDQDPFYRAQLKQFSFANLLRLTSRENFDVTQKKRVKTHSFDVNTNYYYIINRTSNVNIFAGTNINHQNFNATIFELLSGKSVAVANEKATNQVDFSLVDVYGGARYKFLTGMFIFTPGFSVHTYRTKNKQQGTTLSKNLTKILPEFGLKMSLMSSESLQLQYRQNIKFTDIRNLVQGYVLNSYSSVYIGNRDLEYARNHNISLVYTNFKMFNFTNIVASITYEKRMNPIKGSTKLADAARPVDWVSTSVNSAFADENINTYGSYEKTFRKFAMTVDASLTYALSNNLVQSNTGAQVNNEATTFNQNYGLVLDTRFKKMPNFNLMYRVNLNRYEQRGRVTRFITHMPSVEVDYDFLSAFKFSTRCTYNHFSDENKVLNKYAIWNADLSYRKQNSPWELALECTNLLNIQNINQSSNSDISFSVRSFVVQPRFALFSLRYFL